MRFNTKLNIGDPVWHVSSRDGCVRQVTITGLTLTHRPSYEFQGECQTKVVYESDDNCNFAEEHEGRFWFRSRQAIIDYLTQVLKPVGNGKKSNPISLPKKDGLSEAFEEFFGDSKPTPPVRDANEGLHRVFDEVFNPKQAPPIEDFKIVIPPSVRKRIERITKQVFKKTSPVSKITEGLAKKDRCDCGVHRVSEIQRRARASAKNFLKAMKPLPGIREKTLTEYADEL